MLIEKMAVFHSAALWIYALTWHILMFLK
jgi:hypothetical protein